jgi:autotransporter strand-loop-strand O-heptosyltransferase
MTLKDPAAPPAPSPSPAHALPPTPAMPTHPGARGIWYDFNEGCRVRLPASEPGHEWRVRFTDLDTENVLFDARLAGGLVRSPRIYYLRYRIEVWREGALVFTHDYNPAGRQVLIHIHGGVLGDTLGWFPYAVKFMEKHGCRLTCAMAATLIPLFQDAYPAIAFTPHEAARREDYYATYHLGVSFNDDDRRVLPCDFRLVGAHRAIGYALGVDPTEARPAIALADAGRPIAEPYVCIAVQSTLQCKYWNHPDGWREVVADLKANGYRVICIDRAREYGLAGPLNRIPDGAEDETGDRPLTERARWLAHADFFVGLASGLSWLAWAVETPVVMISGFSHPIAEFATPYRVINYNVCNSCWNDPRLTFDRNDFLWCPRQGGTPRQFECSRHITPAQVKAMLRTIPGFGAKP